MGYQFPQPISEQIWNEKYRLVTHKEDIPDDDTVEATWMRIAQACAEAPVALNSEAAKERFQVAGYRDEFQKDRLNLFNEILSNFGFLPAGRVTAGAGSGRNVTLFNCYVMNTVADSLESIFQNLKEAALTMQQGGGIGYDFSTLRPKDAPVKHLDADASGPLTFMDVWDSMCRTIMSAGSRRGAMMATMICTHPDIEKFIVAKHDATRLRMFNVSVMATDAFMEAVKNDKDWALVHKAPPADTSLGMDKDGNWIYRYVSARDLWNLIMENTYNHAEPGVLFIDRINKNNNLWYIEKITSTNPCGEQPLPPYGACLLGSVNLTQVVINPFSQNAQIDYKKLDVLVRGAVNLLDAVIDISNFPLPEQLKEAKMKRRMGIGVTGLADMLVMMRMVYGSETSLNLIGNVMRFIFEVSYDESANLAALLGPCEITRTKKNRELYLQGENIQKLPQAIRDKILKHGIRNSHLTSVAPTGTISLFAGNVSSGGEPIFAFEYFRKVLNKDGTKREEEVMDYAVKLYRDMFPNSTLPDYFVSAQTLTPEAHLLVQARLQKWVDSSISKTINLPESISFDDFKQVYLDAYQLGCKGCTTYRPNTVTGSILSVKEDKPVVEAKEALTVVPMKRPDVLHGHTYKLKWQNTNAYVTINDFEENGRIVPFEIFINSKEIAHFQWTVALTRMISGVFRRGGDVSFVVEELKNVFDPNGGSFYKGRYVPSFIALLGATLEEHLKAVSYFGPLPPMEVRIEAAELPVLAPELQVKPAQCPSCKEFSLVSNGGCPTCTSCGYSKCS